MNATSESRRSCRLSVDYQEHARSLTLTQSSSINPIDLSTKLNQFTLPEMAAHAFITVLFLLSGQWLAFLLNAPLVAFNGNK